MQGEASWALEALGVARIVFCSIDCATGFMLRSGNCTEMLGLAPAGSATSWPLIIFPEDRVQYEDARRRLTPRHPNFEVEYRLKNGQTGKQFCALDRGAGEFDGEGCLTGIRGAIIDVSARISVERELRNADRLHALAFEAARMAAWHFDVATDRFTFTDELLALLEIDRGHFDGTPAALENAIHPDDREAWRRAHDGAHAPGSRMEVEFRLLLPGACTRWILSRGEVVRRADGAPLESYGVMIDVTERKNWERRQAMLLRELSHRVKNTLAVVQSIARQTLRSTPSPGRFVDAFEGRIRSLAASHNLLTEADWGGTRLHTVIHHQVAATVHDYAGRFHLKGPEVVLSAEVATQLGLVLHELATNAATHGALSVPEGHVDIIWTAASSKLSLLWREHGGPVLDKKPQFQGFGTLLMTSTAQKVSQRFLGDGLVCKLEFAL